MMETLLIILIIALAALAFNMQARYEMRRRREAETAFESDIDRMRAPDQETRTIDLIGEEAYAEMTQRIDRVLRDHCHHPCITLELTCGPDSRNGNELLHKTLPGDPLTLNPCTEMGVEWVDVYSNGVRIGRLALEEAEEYGRIIRKAHVCGAYVAEQNCYGIEDSHRMSIIVFYEPSEIKSLRMPGAIRKERATEKGKTYMQAPGFGLCEN